LDQREKLAIIRNFGAIDGITQSEGWTAITPDDQNDWINQRDASFDKFLKIGDKKGAGELLLFDNYSLGVVTNRDALISMKRNESVFMAGMLGMTQRM
jgi:predicted helicase